jgi:hypothetical protein
MDNDGTGHEYDCQQNDIVGKKTQYMEEHIKRWAYLDTMITKKEYCVDQSHYSPVSQDDPKIEQRTG